MFVCTRALRIARKVCLQPEINCVMHSGSVSSYKEWFPQKVLNGENPIALLVLNQPINEENIQFVKQQWHSAAYRVAVDGGAVQLKDIFKGEDMIPDLICGDFDSVTPEVLAYYKEKGVLVIHTPDQDETDFTKALKLTVQYIGEKKLQVSAIVAIARNGDRLDHVLGNLNTLYSMVEITSIPIFILGNCSLTWLLATGSHRVHIAKEFLDSYVGLIPLGEECTNVSTTGLKWNLNNDKMKFGRLISTCNKFDGSSFVTVTTDTNLIWTMEINFKNE